MAFFQCPNCGHRLTVADKHIGLLRRCPECSGRGPIEAEFAEIIASPPEASGPRKANSEPPVPPPVPPLAPSPVPFFGEVSVSTFSRKRQRARGRFLTPLVGLLCGCGLVLLLLIGWGVTAGNVQLLVTPDGQQQSFASPIEVVARGAEPAVAVVSSDMGTGTGFLVGPGLLATNLHVVEGEMPDRLKIYFPSAPKAARGPFNAELHYFDAVQDVALLKVETSLPPIPISAGDPFRRAREVLIIGNPGAGSLLQLENAVSQGLLSNKVVMAGAEWYQVSASINPGNSGGPVLGMDGTAIGVATMKATQQEGIAFAVPASRLRAALTFAESQTLAERQNQWSHFRYRVVFRKLNRAGSQLAGALVASFDVSYTFGPAQQRLLAKGRAATETVRSVNPVLQLIRSDPNILAQARDDLVNLALNLQSFAITVKSADFPMKVGTLDRLQQVVAERGELIQAIGREMQIE